jgi:hypothetical protein
MLKRIFLWICKVCGKREPVLWAETASMLIIVSSIIVSTAIFLFMIIYFDWYSFAERFGVFLSLVSMFIFSYFYFKLVKVFRKFALELPSS